MNLQSFYLDGVLTEVSQHNGTFDVQQFRPLSGMAYGWSPTTHAEWNMAWFRNVSKAKKECAIKTFKLLEQEDILIQNATNQDMGHWIASEDDCDEYEYIPSAQELAQ